MRRCLCLGAALLVLAGCGPRQDSRKEAAGPRTGTAVTPATTAGVAGVAEYKGARLKQTLLPGEGRPALSLLLEVNGREVLAYPGDGVRFLDTSGKEIPRGQWGPHLRDGKTVLDVSTTRQKVPEWGGVEVELIRLNAPILSLRGAAASAFPTKECGRGRRSSGLHWHGRVGTRSHEDARANLTPAAARWCLSRSLHGRTFSAGGWGAGGSWGLGTGSNGARWPPLAL